MAGQKFLTNNAGVITEKQSVQTSAGAGSAGDIPALNASGVLDSTIVNSTVVSSGASSAGKLTALNSAGQLDLSVLPTGVGPDTQSILASEAISAGAFVNVYSNAGTANIRNADNTAAGKQAHGFVLSAVSSGTNGLVYFVGNNTAVTSQTVGNVYLGTVGAATSTAPSGSGNVVQLLGVATSATSINTNAQQPIVLA
jgi:hypothetical protein